MSELAEYRRRNPTKAPSNTVIAIEIQVKPGFVIQYERWNLVVEAELTREQFLQAVRQNQTHADAVTGIAEVDGSRLDMSTARDAVDPPDDLQYYYRVRRL